MKNRSKGEKSSSLYSASTASRDMVATVVVCFLSSVVVCGRKAPKSICQQASPGFLRLRSGQALRLRASKPSVCDRSAKRFAPTARRGRQDDDIVGPGACEAPEGRTADPSLRSPGFLLRLVALANFMRLSLRERRTRNHVQRSVAGNPGRDDKKERVSEREDRCQRTGRLLGRWRRRQQLFFVRNQKSHNLSG